MPPMLELRGIERRFPGADSGARGLVGVDLEVGRGEMVALIGPSGAGKSTLLRIIAGLDSPDRGVVRIGGEDVARRSPPERRVGMSLDDAAMYEHLSVRRNLLAGLDRFGLRGTDAERAVHEAAELVGALGLLDRLPQGLSAGERRRVSLARAIARRPAVLLLDEPLAHLDQRTRLDIREDLRRLHEATQAATVLVTHDHLDAIAIADRLAYLDRGRVLQVGLVEAFDEPAHVAVAIGRSWAPLNVVTRDANGADPASGRSSTADPHPPALWTATLGTTGGPDPLQGAASPASARIWTATLGGTSGEVASGDGPMGALAFEPAAAHVVVAGTEIGHPAGGDRLHELGVGTVTFRTPVVALSPLAAASAGPEPVVDPARPRTASGGGRVLLTVQLGHGACGADSPAQRIRVEADATQAPPIGAEVRVLLDPTRVHRFGPDGVRLRSRR